MTSFATWWKLGRGEHAIMTFAAVAAAATLSSGRFSPSYLFFALGPALIVLASFIFNDVMDLPSDKALGRKERPLVSRQILPRHAFAASVALFVFGLAVCLASSFVAFEIALAYSLLSLSYSFYLKKLPLAGNAVVATTYAISFVYGNAVAVNSLSNWNPLVLSFAAFAFLAGLGRELLITLRDVEGDRKIGALTLPMVIGTLPTVLLASALLLLAVAATGSGFGYAANNIVYLLFVGACDTLLVACCMLALRDSSFEGLSRVRNLTLLAFQLALAGFIAMAALVAF